MYEIGQEEIQALTRVIQSRKLFRFQGAQVATECSSFEQEFAQLLRTNEALLVNSGTSALVVALRSLGIGPGDEVIIPSFTFFATAAAVIQVQAVPIIVNIDATLSIDPKEVEKNITPQTKAIIAVHMDGRACDMASLKQLADAKKISLIEDVAQAIGGYFQNQRLGTFGEFGCFSFNQDKIIACGEGGALVTSSASLIKKARLAHDASCSFGPTWKDTFDTKEIFIGASMRVSELDAAFLRVQLERLETILTRLRQNKKILRAHIDDKALVPDNCALGDCATTLYLKANDPEQILKIARELKNQGLDIRPISSRPAHAVWQWLHLLREERFAHPQQNPFLHSSRRPKEIYHQGHFLTTMDYLTCSLRVAVPYEASEDELNHFSQIIGRLL